MLIVVIPVPTECHELALMAEVQPDFYKVGANRAP